MRSNSPASWCLTVPPIIQNTEGAVAAGTQTDAGGGGGAGGRGGAEGGGGGGWSGAPTPVTDSVKNILNLTDAEYDAQIKR
jgi:hypothetical protein